MSLPQLTVSLRLDLPSGCSRGARFRAGATAGAGGDDHGGCRLQLGGCDHGGEYGHGGGRLHAGKRRGHDCADIRCLAAGRTARDQSPISIKGGGLVISGEGFFRIFFVAEGGDLIMDSLTLRDGSAQVEARTCIDWEDGEWTAGARSAIWARSACRRAISAAMSLVLVARLRASAQSPLSAAIQR